MAGHIEMISEKPFSHLDHPEHESSFDLARILMDLNGFAEGGNGLIAAVRGDGGTGKTSVLLSLMSFYRHHRKRPVLYFDAWRYDDLETLLPVLLKKLSDLGEGGAFGPPIKETLKKASTAAYALVPTMQSPAMDGAPKHPEKTFDRSDKIEEKKLSRRFAFDNSISELNKALRAEDDPWTPRYRCGNR